MNVSATPFFQDRRHAAERLAAHLSLFVTSDTLIVATSREGAKMGSYMSHALRLPLELVLCNDLKLPGEGERTIGSICATEVFTHDIPRDIPQDYISHRIHMVEQLQHRLNVEAYGSLPDPVFKQKTIILTTDWVNSSDSLISSVRFIRKQKPARVIVAVPVIRSSAMITLRDEVDDLVFLHVTEDDTAPSEIYKSLPAVTMEEVSRCILISKQNFLQGADNLYPCSN